MIEQQRDRLSKALIYEDGAPRYAVSAENDRVKELLDEQYTDPYADDSRLKGLGRALLLKLGLYHSEPGQLIERPHLQASQQEQVTLIAGELDRTRALLKNTVVKGVDDVSVDDRLGLRTDDCMLPPIFREHHRQVEETSDNEITFLKWMTDHATNEQLMNVWQWHDTYLDNLDTDPSFREQIEAAKANYTVGSQRAIAAGVLHPAMVVPEQKMGDLTIVHGSPFSPLLSGSIAYADQAAGAVQIREGVSDFTLYHEMAHVLYGGMYPQFTEGITDLVAAEVYNHAHPDREPVDPRNMVYTDQIATLEAISRMGGGRFGLYELSRIYADSDNPRDNTFLFTARADEAIGLPVALSLSRTSEELIQKYETNLDGSRVRRATQLFVRGQAELLATLMFDDEGNKVATTINELGYQLLQAETSGKYDSSIIEDGIKAIIKIRETQQALEDTDAD